MLPSPLALVHADVLDFASGALLEDVTVLVRDGLIREISADAELKSLAALEDVLLVVNDGRVVLDRLRFELRQ